MDFRPIQLHEYVKKHLKSNPGDRKAEVTARLQATVKAYRNGARCGCGQAIWVIGSAVASRRCFTCITGSTDSSEDYEIAEACDKPFYPSSRLAVDSESDSDLEDVPF